VLTDIALKQLKPRQKLYKIADRDGMYVAVAPPGKSPSAMTTVSMAGVKP
jgi:hypothetical protein